jgi:hypothetical protein
MQRLLIIGGILLVIAGLAWPVLSRLGLGRLPGDIAIRGEHGSFYFPIMTCILVSALLSLIFWLAGRF